MPGDVQRVQQGLDGFTGRHLGSSGPDLFDSLLGRQLHHAVQS
eukprot:CAMPEP_0205917148 /NCGR_PEP_ID=MMETSP1325-20131115/8977_1 /ASSEMBLY_ACC=CAM_ASM_000708 /TAXON_ID=236786 /ORGANISM="Florenciella sp., Strain RCC1007" /LENGTH=42 /DNA_ID= /DNA_START= /DNA_END= /DNA_ORIENTATION=